MYTQLSMYIYGGVGKISYGQNKCSANSYLKYMAGITALILPVPNTVIIDKSF